nr:hypothetical protein [Microbispora rosea]
MTRTGTTGTAATGMVAAGSRASTRAIRTNVSATGSTRAIRTGADTTGTTRVTETSSGSRSRSIGTGARGTGSRATGTPRTTTIGECVVIPGSAPGTGRATACGRAAFVRTVAGVRTLTCCRAVTRTRTGEGVTAPGSARSGARGSAPNPEAAGSPAPAGRRDAETLRHAGVSRAAGARTVRCPRTIERTGTGRQATAPGGTIPGSAPGSDSPTFTGMHAAEAHFHAGVGHAATTCAVDECGYAGRGPTRAGAHTRDQIVGRT